LPVSRFYPVLLMALTGFVAPGPPQVLFRLRNTVREPVGCGILLGQAPFGSFSLGSEVDDGAHDAARKLSVVTK
jgi:hypothetical protein